MGQEKLNISIVLPVYNVSLYIERCLKSVMTQTYPVMECIIVDDASPDDSITKCERMIDGYNGPIRFVILHHDYNRGLSAARNTGTEAAHGDYIYYLDSDDDLTSDCLEKLAKPIERDPSIEMVVGNYQRFSDNTSIGKITREEEFQSSAAVREFFFDRRILYVSAWNRLILKKFLTEHKLYFTEGILYEDAPWNHYMVKYIQHLYVIPDVTYHYHVRPLSICTGSSENEKAKNRGIVYEDIANHFTPGEETREAQFYLDSYFHFFIKNRRLESFKRALPLFEKALVRSENRRDHLLLRVLKLSSRSVFWYWILVSLMKIRLAVLYPFRRITTIWKKKKFKCLGALRSRL